MAAPNVASNAITPSERKISLMVSSSHKSGFCVFLAEKLLDVLVADPRQRQRGGPWPGVCPHIIDGDVVLQRIQVGAGEALHQVERLSMGQPSVGEPEPLVV